MGLDMYLKGKRYLASYDDKDKEVAESVQKLFPELAGREGTFGGPCIQQIEASVGYWRKANAIHKWFVDNVQDGEDKCRPHSVARDQLVALRDTCQQVLANKKLAGELLPAQEGFFFGGTDYDEWYFKDLERTVEIIDSALTLDEGQWDFEYRSSW
jgi:hypothetical protein